MLWRLSNCQLKIYFKSYRNTYRSFCNVGIGSVRHLTDFRWYHIPPGFLVPSPCTAFGSKRSAAIKQLLLTAIIRKSIFIDSQLPRQNLTNYLSYSAIVSLFLMHCWYSIGAVKKNIELLKSSINLISERKLLFTCCRKGPTASAQPLKFNGRKTRRISIVHLWCNVHAL